MRKRRREGSEEAESSQKYSVLYFILKTNENTLLGGATPRACRQGEQVEPGAAGHARVETCEGLPSPAGTPAGAPPARPGAALPHRSAGAPRGPAQPQPLQLVPSSAPALQRSRCSVLGVRLERHGVGGALKLRSPPLGHEPLLEILAKGPPTKFSQPGGETMRPPSWSVGQGKDPPKNQAAAA